MQKTLQDYQRVKGGYPESLRGLAFTNWPQEPRALADIRKMNYHRTDSGYELSYAGWGRYQLSVSNLGAAVSKRMER